MGTVRKFTCPDCAREWQVKLGHGISHAMLDRVLLEFPEEMRQTILADAGGNQMPVFDFQYRAACCRRCGKIVSVPVLALNGKVYAAGCPECSAAAELSEEKTPLLCPHCGTVQLSTQTVGRWD